MTTLVHPRLRSPRGGRARLVLTAVVLAGSWSLAPDVAQAQAPEPYRDPPFSCEVIDYGTAAPEVPGPEADPLCVRYDKTNITVSTMEAVDFLAGEPGRVAIVAGKCSYWQQDHWIIRAAPDTTPLVEWEGSYWYDARTGAAAGIVRGMRVGGEPADGTAFADALRPLIGDEGADQLGAYAAEGGGGGATFALPEGFGAPTCSVASAPSDPPANEPAPMPAEPEPEVSDTAPARSLPSTGSAPALGAALAAALGALAGRRLLRRG